MLTRDRLRELLSYDPGTGTFTWLVNRGSRAIVGKAAGNSTHGYVQIQLDGRNYKGHRLAWLYVHGVWPSCHTDHINGIGIDNRIANLRDVACATNIQNQKRAPRNSTSGLLGASRSGNRWRANIVVAQKQTHLGCFATAEEAHAAYVAAKRVMHEGCTI